jgi:hypothetical protein
MDSAERRRQTMLVPIFRNNRLTHEKSGEILIAD